MNFRSSILAIHVILPSTSTTNRERNIKKNGKRSSFLVPGENVKRVEFEP